MQKRRESCKISQNSGRTLFPRAAHLCYNKTHTRKGGIVRCIYQSAGSCRCAGRMKWISSRRRGIWGRGAARTRPPRLCWSGGPRPCWRPPRPDTSPSRRGVQVFYGDTGTGGAFAAKLQSVFNTYLNEKYCGRSYSALAGDYFIAKCSSIPSVIAECGFISNSEDLKLLKSSAYADEIAECIARCVKSAAAGV